MKQEFYVWYDALMEEDFAIEVKEISEKFFKQISSEKNLILKIEAEDFKEALKIYREKMSLNQYQDLVANQSHQNSVKHSSKFLH